MHNGLPERGEVLPSVFDDDLRMIGFAYIRGDLKTRREMNIAAAVRVLLESMDFEPDYAIMMEGILDAAWRNDEV